jgi:transcriptional regulator with XRE-family HTH domain
MPKVSIPVDTAHVDETEISDEEFRSAGTAQAEMRGQVLSRPEAQARYEASLEEIRRHQATLAHVRRARGFAQSTVAELTGMNQSEVSKLERRSDMLISTLRKFIEATGGELHVVASYPEGSVELRLPWGSEETVEDAETLPIDVRHAEPARTTSRHLDDAPSR